MLGEGCSMRHTILRTAAAAGLVALGACRDRPRSPTEPLPAALASVSAADAAPGDADAAAPLRPAEGDRVLFDVRESLQSAGDVDAAVALWNLRDVPRHWAFTSDADGAGTHA